MVLPSPELGRGRRLARYGEIARSLAGWPSASGRLIPARSGWESGPQGRRGGGGGRLNGAHFPEQESLRVEAADLDPSQSPGRQLLPERHSNRTFRGDSPTSFSSQNQGLIITTFTQATPSSKGKFFLNSLPELSHLVTAEVSPVGPHPRTPPNNL